MVENAYRVLIFMTFYLALSNMTDQITDVL